MNYELRQIYDDLSSGRLSQDEALQRIETLKLGNGFAPTGVLLATPVWRAGLAAAAGAGEVAFAEHHILLCGVPAGHGEEVRRLLPHSACESLQVAAECGIARCYTDYAVACFERIQMVLRGRRKGQVLVQIVAAGPEQALLAGLSALLQTAALENPQLVGQVILVPAGIGAAELARQLEEERAVGREALIRFEGGTRQVRIWEEIAPDPHDPPTAFDEGGVYLITGGLGRLGTLFAREILDQTREARVILTGRSDRSSEAEAVMQTLSAHGGGRVTYRRLDLSDRDQVERMIAGVCREHGRLSGILHSAGMIADDFLVKKESAAFRDVLAPKVTGTCNLDQASRDVDLDFFFLFSSVAGALGNVGQADYSAANAFLDHFAAYRNRLVAAGERRGRTRSINWPLWRAGGMWIDAASEESLRRATGMERIDTGTAMSAFHRSLALPDDEILVGEGDLAQMRRVLIAGRPAAAPLPVENPAPPMAANLDVAGSHADELAERTEHYLRRQLSRLLKMPSHAIDADAALEQYGIDSILALKMTGQLEQTFGPLPKTLFFEYRSIRELTEYFLLSHRDRLPVAAAPMPAEGCAEPLPVVAEPRTGGGLAPNRRVARRRGAPGVAGRPEAVAIIGLSGRYPQAVNIDAYWENLREGKDCIVEVPPERWDWREYFTEDRARSGHHYSRWGGFIEGVDEFDPLFFGISPKEAKHIDPQERLFLQHAWAAIEDAGYTRAGLQVPDETDLAGQVGVYVGVMYNEYQLFGVESSMRGKRVGVAGSVASIANRVSYVLNVHGPSITLDTMCSSSLTAIHLACQDLKLGRISMAVAGGVNVSIHPNKYLVLSGGQFISSDGHCQSFGEGGDGYIPGEGVGVVVLKRLSEAERDGDHVYAVIRGSAVNHGGRTNGYTVPNPQAQASAISRALAEAHMDARHVSYVEAHGTGTKLGDPVEIAALGKAYHRTTDDTAFCLIGSAKSNIGHCESAAGIAGLSKVLLQMQHREIVPSLHSARLNPHIDFASTPFVVNQALCPWEQPVIDGRTLPRIAGVSSFGAGGSNAHLIVEEYEAPHRPSASSSEAVILLSARTVEQLQQKARDLLDFILVRRNGVDLTSLAYTLQVGREAMDERLGFIASSVDDVIEKLQAIVAGEQNIDDVHRGQARRDKEALSLFRSDSDLQETIGRWIAKGSASKLLSLWVKGLDFDWTSSYGEATPRRMSLPTYPFAKERYWIDMAAPAVAVSSPSALLHPLVHRHTSDLSEVRYSSTFTGLEPFFDSERGKLLAHAAYLEMARAAIAQAFPSWQESGFPELRNAVWLNPMIVLGSREVNISLVPGEGQVEYEIYSRDGDEEVVHCQGVAVPGHGGATSAVDLRQLGDQLTLGTWEPARVYAELSRIGVQCGPALQAIGFVQRGRGQLLVQLRLPAAEVIGDPYVLHPALLEGALQAAALIGGESALSAGAHPSPIALDAMRIHSPCTPEMAAWVRYSPASEGGEGVVSVDIDLYDARGTLAVQMRGMSWPAAALPEAVEEALDPSEAPAAAAEVPATARVRAEIAMARGRVPAAAPRTRTVSLAAPASLVVAPPATVVARRREVGIPPITLSHPTRHAISDSTADPSVRLYDYGDGILLVQIDPPRGAATPDVIRRLLQAFEHAQRETLVKALMVVGLERCLGRGSREDFNEAIGQSLYRALASFPYPTIAVLREDAIGAPLLAAAVCDFLVCNEDAAYGYTDPSGGYYASVPETILFEERFGEARAYDLLYLSGGSTGRQLRAKGWTCPIVPAAQVDVVAQTLASSLATKPRVVLRLLKHHLTRDIVRLVEALTPVDPAVAERGDRGGELHTPDRDVAVIRVDGNVRILRSAASELRALVEQTCESPRRRAAVLVSDDGDPAEGFEQAAAEEVVVELERLIVDAPFPIVAAFPGNATGAGWLLGQSCDAAVHSRTGVYSAAAILESPLLAQTAVAAFAHRFGDEAAAEILLTGTEYRGGDLRHRIPTALVAEPGDVIEEAIGLATALATLPHATFISRKQHATTALREKIGALADQDEPHEEADAPLPAAPVAIPLRSQVVMVTAHPDGVVVVRMADRDAKNMFSDAFIDGVREAFAHIGQTPGYKVVILTGYGSYFASGGTKESLMAIQAGRAQFTDSKVFQLPLDCRLPVIAAMQGHGIGAGWTLGAFADLVLLSEESRYVSPYVEYGFTPGAGATLILAKRFGHDIARESLLTAHAYAGRDLKERGVRVSVLPRADIESEALALARRIAGASRRPLMALKRQLAWRVRQAIEETYRLELAMHERTFVGQPETLAQIHEKFQERIEASPALLQEAHAAAAVSVVPAPEPAGVRRPADSDELAAITAGLKALLAEELQMAPTDIDDHAQFVDLGLDSISGVTWIRRINEKYQTSILATKVYSYPTLAELGRYVKEEAEKSGSVVRADVPVAAEPAAQPAATPPPQHGVADVRAVKKPLVRRGRGLSRGVAGVLPSGVPEPIAVIGMAGQFPQARNLEEFWQNIAGGRNCISEVPRERWDIDAYYHPGEAVAGKTSSRWAGLLEEYDRFDPLFFNISPVEAESMDPQQRLFLQACWHSIEDAGYDARALSGRKCGVFVGCAGGDYHQLSRQHQLSAQGFTGNALSILAARISYFLNLQGPCVSIDTACSSSLVSIAHACDSLTSGASELALAGGVYVMVGPGMHIKTSQAGMLSADGRCFTFDRRANGFVPSEGVGVVLLKRLSDAQRDHDIIHAVIRGWAVNQDGKTNGITAPSPESQARLEQDVYDKFRIDPAHIQLVEAHGTGTKLGDPIEVEGLKHAFGKYTARKEYCALGSVKSNIGHSLAAAGIAGVLKLVLSVKHRQLPPTINFERLNEHIDLQDSPFFVNSRLQAWEREEGRPRQAATSSFGFSGTNAHVVVSEYVPPAGAVRPVAVAAGAGQAIIPLSARTEEQLEQKMRDLLEFLRRQETPVDLQEMAYTLQVGREPMEERLGLLASSVDDVAAKLQAHLDGKRDQRNVYRGQVRAATEVTSIIGQDDDAKEAILHTWIGAGRLSKLLESWANGMDVDWNRLYGEVKPQRIPLPMYPFAKERYWIEAPAERHASADGPVAVLHPLLHGNTSDLTEQRYSTTFTGDEFFLADHRVRTDGPMLQKVLPGVAYLEMARAALEHAAPTRRSSSSILELRDTVWLTPVIVTEPKEVSIALFAPNDEERVQYEVYSITAGHETVHCRGEAIFSAQPAPPKLDLHALRRASSQARLDSSEVYRICATMGLGYGPAHQSVVALHVGETQVLADLRLPAAANGADHRFVLHPSLLDGALQASLGLFVDLEDIPSKPSVPFSLEGVRIFRPCTSEMVAWVRRATGAVPGDRSLRVDADLCDMDGNVLVQVRGFVSRVMDGDARAVVRDATAPRLHVRPRATHQPAAFDGVFYESLVADVANRKVSVDEAVDLG